MILLTITTRCDMRCCSTPTNSGMRASMWSVAAFYLVIIEGMRGLYLGTRNYARASYKYLYSYGSDTGGLVDIYPRAMLDLATYLYDCTLRIRSSTASTPVPPGEFYFYSYKLLHNVVAIYTSTK